MASSEHWLKAISITGKKHQRGSMNSTRQRISSGLKTTALLLVSLAASVAIAEITLRVMGSKPWSPSTTMGDGSRGNIPLMTEKHPTLGWVNKPGKYQYPGFSPEVARISVSILPSGSRSTNSTNRIPPPSSDKIIFAGGSYTFGFAISDDETFAWKTQTSFPDYDVINLGVPGYGTYQSLLMLEEKLQEIEGKKVIFYGYIGHHEMRNVLHGSWADMFSRAEGETPLPPYATLNEQGELVRHEVSSRSIWPFRGSLALVNRAEIAWLYFISADRWQQGEAVTEQIILKMQALADSYDASFVVLLLKSKSVYSSDLVNFLQSNGVGHADCNPESFGAAYRVTGEGHPNGQLNSLWAECISNYLEIAKP
jgi:hypothetical protein